MSGAAAAMRESEIRPDELRAEQWRRFKRDIARLGARRGEFVSAPCPACGESRARVAFRKYCYTYRSCRACETMYVSPRPSPAVLDWYYETSENYQYWNTHIFPASEDARRARMFRPRAERLARICREHRVRTGALLEVGAGFGTFCEEAARLGMFERVVAVEPTPSLAATCRRKGIEVIEQPIEKVRFEPGTIDVVASFEVIEHLFEPRRFVQACAAVLSPGGLLVLSCPNVKGFDVMTLGKASDTVDVEHLNYFHPTSLSAMVVACGFEVVQVLTPGQLDAELVRKKILAGEWDAAGHPFLEHVLIDAWDQAGAAFQAFLAANKLSSHMWLAARKLPAERSLAKGRR